MRPHRCSNKPDCFGCRIKTITIAPSAMPTRGNGSRVAWANEADKKTEKDLRAYKSMFHDGLHPRTTEGAHDVMMRSEEKFEVEAFGPMDAQSRTEYKARLQEIKLADPKGRDPVPVPVRDA